MRTKTIKSLRKKLWDTFSIYVRQRDAGICVSCGARKDWKEMHAGHFIHLGKSKLLGVRELDEANVWCQCPKCNTFLHGNAYNFGKRIEAKYGEEMIARIRRQKAIPKKWTLLELEEWIDYYKKTI